MAQRQRRTVGTSGAACGICGAPQTVLVESRARRRGWDRLNPAWRPQPRLNEVCAGCGAKYRLEDGRRV